MLPESERQPGHVGLMSGARLTNYRNISKTRRPLDGQRKRCKVVT